MAATATPGSVSNDQALDALSAEECSPPRSWGNGAGDVYGWHSHDFHKVLFCLEGSIVFHTEDGDVGLTAGDRLDLEPFTSHAATVGPQGCRCVEASR
jgi:hypothetical protein